MPSPFIKNLAKQHGKTEKEIEKLWKKAKEITSEEFGKDEKDFGRQEYAYCTGVVKRILGIDESVLDPSQFLEGDKTAKEYVETLVSGNFSIGNVNPPKKKKEDDDDDDDEEDEEDEEDLEEKSKTKKCPDCGNKYLVQTGYCVTCKKKVKENDKEDKKKESVNEETEDNTPEGFIKALDDMLEE